MKLYRGTQLGRVKGRQKITSWTPSLPVAVIYSAEPGDPWINRKTSFLPTSTVHIGEMSGDTKVLEICGGYINCHFNELLEQLEFGKPNGMTQEEGEKIIRLLHRRYMNEVTMDGGPFKYVVYEDEHLEEKLDPEEVPFDIMDPQTLLSWEVLPNFEDDAVETAKTLVIDTFALADLATVRNIARRLGYQAIAYDDVFVGGEYAAPKLLGCDVQDIVDEQWDLEDEDVPVHRTIRPLHKGVIKDIEAVPTAELLPEVTCEAVANPGLKRKLLR